MVFLFKGRGLDGNEHTFIVYEKTYESAYKKLTYELVRNSTVLVNLWRIDTDEFHTHIIS